MGLNSEMETTYAVAKWKDVSPQARSPHFSAVEYRHCVFAPFAHGFLLCDFDPIMAMPLCVHGEQSFSMNTGNQRKSLNAMRD